MRKNIILPLIVALLLVIVCACTAVRTEFYRAETEHMYNQAKTAYDSGDYETARMNFTRVTECDPSFAQAWVGLPPKRRLTPRPPVRRLARRWSGCRWIRA